MSPVSYWIFVLTYCWRGGEPDPSSNPTDMHKDPRHKCLNEIPVKITGDNQEGVPRAPLG